MYEWNFNMSTAPRGTPIQRIIQRPEGEPAVVTTIKKEIIHAASSCGKVISTYYIDKEDRWCMFSKDDPPIAWCKYPDYPVDIPERLDKYV